MQTKKSLKRLLTAVLALLLFCGTASTAAQKRHYTKAQPLIYEDAWDLWPYCFVDDQGQPSGFNIDLLDELMRRLDIPYVVRLKASADALDDLKHRKADLTIGMYAPFHDEYGRYGRSVIALFTHSVLSPKSDTADIKTFADLARYRVAVHHNSFSHHEMIERGMAANAIPFDDMIEEVLHCAAQDTGRVVWNTRSLKWIAERYHLDNMKLRPIEMNHGEYRFMSNDTTLLSRIDSVYEAMRLDQSVLNMQQKWFYNQRPEPEKPSYWWWALGLLLPAALLIMLFNRIVRRRIVSQTRQIVSQNGLVKAEMDSRQALVWLYSVAERKYYTLNADGSVTAEYLPIDFSHFYKHRDFEALRKAVFDLKDNPRQQTTLNVRGRQNGDEPGRDYEVVLTPVTVGDSGVETVMGVQRDVTRQLREQAQARELLLRYHIVFYSALVDMFYFDKDGVMADINDNACRTFGIADRAALCARRIRIGDIPFFYGIDTTCLSAMHQTAIVSDEELNAVFGTGVKGNRIYYESVLTPIRTPDGELICVFLTGRNISELVESYHSQQESIRQLQQATDSIQAYTDNINYALQVTDIRLTNYYPDQRLLVVTSNLNQPEYRLSQLRCIGLVSPEDRPKAIRMVNAMDRKRMGAFDMTVKTVFRDRERGESLYLQFSGVPMYDERGTLTHYFGLCRNVTALTVTERQLKAETLKAQETELLKSSFLTNMSYEIRTPLNAVVGFAELFDTDHSAADEQVFVEEIKRNSNELLALINDILELSRLDANMVEFVRQTVDFALLFESWCQLGWAGQVKPYVQYTVENPYNHLVCSLDDVHLGRVVQLLCANAAFYTERGMVRAKYEFRNNTLTVIVEDTGVGIEADVLPHIFERFTSSGKKAIYGTGLELPIIHEMVCQMGGHIEFMSQVGKGTTAWVTIPCVATELDKKDILT